MLNTVLFNKKAGFQILPFLVVFFGFSQENDGMHCSKGNYLSMGDYAIFNNQWGLDKVKKGNVKICIYKAKDNFGWNFKMPRKSYGVVAYPEIIYGNSPWGTDTTLKALAKVDQIKKLNIRYKAQLKNNSKKMNLSVDIWMLHKEPPISKNISAEIMIWEYTNKFRPNGKKVAIINTEQGEYILRVGKIDRKSLGLGWDYFAFVRKENRTSGTIPVKELLVFLEQKGYIKSEQYISDIEFGTELSNASGEISFSEYKIDLETYN